jgi:demethoxyubiquinone hydroxylase (CLK1/Coq7/Cat5 family)
MDGAFLDWALATFSGYVAADELYEGPYCVLSAVDNRQYKRILYEVLDHDPNHDDITVFLGVSHLLHTRRPSHLRALL